MAQHIVAHTALDLVGIATSSRWFCDGFTGTADALVVAGLIAVEQLKPQKGRAAGYTAFLPDGSPCPARLRAWREPGFKSIRQQEDGTVRLEITIAKHVQLSRRQAEKAAEYEADQERVNRQIAENGHKYRNWAFRQGFSAFAETWEGTKAQLQAAGLGVGQKFPGEPGAPRELRCKCPLGFDFLIRFRCDDQAKAAAGIYTACSWYESRQAEPTRLAEHARGVMREVWTPDRGRKNHEVYCGTAAALVDAGIVANLQYFPGQPGTNKMQASYLRTWQPASSSNSPEWGATIRKQGKSGQFEVVVPASREEIERRKAAEREHEREMEQTKARLSVERRQLREVTNHLEKSVDEFRASRAELADALINVLWRQVFGSEGALSFDIPEGGELYDELGQAFHTIREAVQNADIRRDRTIDTGLQSHLKLAAARNDKSLQSVLDNAKCLRLMQSAPDETKG